MDRLPRCNVVARALFSFSIVDPLAVNGAVYTGVDGDIYERSLKRTECVCVLARETG